MKRVAYAILLAVAAISAWNASPTSSGSFSVSPSSAAPAPSGAAFEARFVFEEEPTAFAHSPSLTELADGRLLVVWFGGSREGAADVVLFQSFWEGESRGWTEPVILTDRERSQSEVGRYINTLGNPALVTGERGRVWLFYVASPGGWSASSIQWKVSEDGARTWSPSHRLVTSPYANLGTLVRTNPFLYQDGTIGLPAYHECVGIFPELLRVSPDGRILAKRRIDHGLSSLQPAISPVDARRAVALLRPRPEREGVAPRILLTETSDAGASWSGPQAIALANSGSSVALLRLRDGRLVAVYNAAETDRADLSLAVSDDEGKSFRPVRRLEQGPEGASFAYPSLIQSRDGRLHVVYAWHYRRIKHVALSPDELEGDS